MPALSDRESVTPKRGYRIWDLIVLWFVGAAAIMGISIVLIWYNRLWAAIAWVCLAAASFAYVLWLGTRGNPH